MHPCRSLDAVEVVKFIREPDVSGRVLNAIAGTVLSGVEDTRLAADGPGGGWGAYLQSTGIDAAVIAVMLVDDAVGLQRMRPIRCFATRVSTIEHMVARRLDPVVLNDAAINLRMQATWLHAEAIAVCLSHAAAGADVDAPVRIEEVIVVNVVT
jgi:hypothetical protein